MQGRLEIIRRGKGSLFLLDLLRPSQARCNVTTILHQPASETAPYSIHRRRHLTPAIDNTVRYLHDKKTPAALPSTNRYKRVVVSKSCVTGADDVAMDAIMSIARKSACRPVL